MPPPRLSEAIHHPATAGTEILALIATLAWWAGTDVTILFADARVAHGQLWRLLTAALLHSNPLHLAFNLYWLWALGTRIEKHFGATLTFAIYAFLAAASGAAEYAMLNGGVGLSGVGFGLLGMLWMLSQRNDRFAGAVTSRTLIVFGGWFFFGIVTTLTGTFLVANVAHAAGSFFGVAIAWTMTAAPSARRTLAIRFAGVVAITLAAATIARPWINCSAYRGYEQASLGYDALATGHNRDAVRWCHDATIMRPDDARNWFNLGIAHDRLTQHQLALIAYERAAALDPANQNYRKTRDTLQDYLASITE